MVVGIAVLVLKKSWQSVLKRFGWLTKKSWKISNEVVITSIVLL